MIVNAVGHRLPRPIARTALWHRPRWRYDGAGSRFQQSRAALPWSARNDCRRGADPDAAPAARSGDCRADQIGADLPRARRQGAPAQGLPQWRRRRRWRLLLDVAGGGRSLVHAGVARQGQGDLRRRARSSPTTRPTSRSTTSRARPSSASTTDPDRHRNAARTPCTDLDVCARGREPVRVRRHGALAAALCAVVRRTGVRDRPGRRRLRPGALFLRPFPAGQLSDRLGRRPTLAIGGLVSGIGNLWCAWATSYPEFIIARFVAGSGAGLVLTTGHVVLADISTPERARPHDCHLPGHLPVCGRASDPFRAVCWPSILVWRHRSLVSGLAHPAATVVAWFAVERDARVGALVAAARAAAHRLALHPAARPAHGQRSASCSSA